MQKPTASAKPNKDSLLKAKIRRELLEITELPKKQMYKGNYEIKINLSNEYYPVKMRRQERCPSHIALIKWEGYLLELSQVYTYFLRTYENLPKDFQLHFLIKLT